MTRRTLARSREVEEEEEDVFGSIDDDEDEDDESSGDIIDEFIHVPVMNNEYNPVFTRAERRRRLHDNIDNPLVSQWIGIPTTTTSNTNTSSNTRERITNVTQSNNNRHRLTLFSPLISTAAADSRPAENEASTNNTSSNLISNYKIIEL